MRKLIIATSILCIATTAHAGPRSGSLIDLLGTIQTLEACGVDLYLDQQTIDTTTPAGKLPTAIYRKLISEEAAPFLGLAVDLVRRFLPNADQTTLIMAAVWLVGQCSIFVRNREQLANPPVSLALNEAAIERLTILVSGWALAGLAQAG